MTPKEEAIIDMKEAHQFNEFNYSQVHAIVLGICAVGHALINLADVIKETFPPKKDDKK